MPNKYLLTSVVTLGLLATGAITQAAQPEERPRARDLGIIIGALEPGEHNAITDVHGVRVGHTTVIEGDDVRTGVTAIIPAPGNLYTDPIPAWIHVGNGYGKLLGLTQVQEFGELESPILLTCTLCVWTAADALKEWTYRQPGMGEHTINPVVGEVNDAVVSNMWAEPLTRDHVFAALDNVRGGQVEEGSVGGGTGIPSVSSYRVIYWPAPNWRSTVRPSVESWKSPCVNKRWIRALPMLLRNETVPS